MTTEMIEKLKSMRVGDFLTFPEEKRKYEIRARGERYIVCTKPFFQTVLYTVLDLEEGVRGTENLVFGHGAERTESCVEMIDRLEGAGCDNGQWHTEVSHRNRISLAVKTFWNMPHKEDLCKVRGQLARGAMCAHVIVGAKHCGFGGECQHKVQVPSAIRALKSGAQEKAK